VAILSDGRYPQPCTDSLVPDRCIVIGLIRPVGLEPPIFWPWAHPAANPQHFVCKTTDHVLSEQYILRFYAIVWPRMRFIVPQKQKNTERLGLCCGPQWGSSPPPSRLVMRQAPSTTMSPSGLTVHEPPQYFLQVDTMDWCLRLVSSDDSLHKSVIVSGMLLT